MSPMTPKPSIRRSLLRKVIFVELLLIALLWVGFIALSTQGLDEMAARRVFPYVRIMEVTAYTAGHESTGKDSDHPDFGVTASTYRLSIGSGELCIAAPPDIAFGTRIFVPGYGAATVKDRGEAIQGDCLDVYYDDLEQARLWGRKRLPVLIFP
ncbi:MAG: hypothetical protein K0Q77_1642 [Anaerosporomusa subterranea]|jgi:3D (Asp-Asp-Asp) domain-containing protein|nr:hypothetical protein [Anaerosporomusa subterranea]